MIRSKKLTKSARGESCTVNVVGVCNYDESTTVAAHLSGGGMGCKADDICIVYACSDCHDAMDGRAPSIEYNRHKLQYQLNAYKRTMVRMIDNGVINIC